MPRGLSGSSFTPRMRSVLGQIMRDAWMREGGKTPPERRMRFNPKKRVSHRCHVCGELGATQKIELLQRHYGSRETPKKVWVHRTCY